MDHDGGAHGDVTFGMFWAVTAGSCLELGGDAILTGRGAMRHPFQNAPPARRSDRPRICWPHESSPFAGSNHQTGIDPANGITILLQDVEPRPSKWKLYKWAWLSAMCSTKDCYLCCRDIGSAYSIPPSTATACHVDILSRVLLDRARLCYFRLNVVTCPLASPRPSTTIMRELLMTRMTPRSTSKFRGTHIQCWLCHHVKGAVSPLTIAVRLSR